MTRPALSARLLAATLIAPLAFALTACNSVQLPEGYAWNVSTEKQNDINTPRGSFRWGFDQSRINESLPATSRDRTNYDYAAVLPKPNFRPPYEPQYTAPVAAPTAASATPNDLFTALDPVPAPPTAGDTAVFMAPTEPAPAPTIARGAFRAPATTEVRVLGGTAAPTLETPAADSGPRTHTVVKGDNYWDLARKYYGKGIRMKDIEAANPGIDPKRLQIGDTLVIPE
ncbi:MAG: LysM peptidoglycan-binding domain-containing protein [Planctomycetota bacterium]